MSYKSPRVTNIEYKNNRGNTKRKGDIQAYCRVHLLSEWCSSFSDKAREGVLTQWASRPRRFSTIRTQGEKPLLPLNSAHSKRVKRGIVRSCLKNSVTNSCLHSAQASSDGQVSRLRSTRCPLRVLTSVTEVLLREIMLGSGAKIPRQDNQTGGRAIYAQSISWFKEDSKLSKWEYSLSAPHKFHSLCKKVITSSISTVCCTRTHRSNFVTSRSKRPPEIFDGPFSQVGWKRPHKQTNVKFDLDRYAGVRATLWRWTSWEVVEIESESCLALRTLFNSTQIKK